ncbi:MAG: peptidase thermolysin, partial [Acidobacteria bacterium]|nr:peptidase thermolysin [Acidobacteriota bacterium]
MRNGHPFVCSFVPPHILQKIAENGDAGQRDEAHAALETAAGVRGERQAMAGLLSVLAVSPGNKRRTVYDALHDRVLPGRILRGESDRAPRHDDAANEAFEGCGRTYDFYQNVFGRSSIDGRGMRLDSSVHFGKGYNNAQWNGRQMVYGDGDGKIFNRFTAALDVVGHELTHGVTQHTAGLEYHDQPGALNEHFSDVLGMLVKQYSLGLTADRSDWLLAPGLFGPAIHGKALRSMKAPGTAYDDKLLGKDPQPAHMKDYKRQKNDAGGVHVNSGIPNHAFYLVATAIGGKAWEVAGKVWYETLTKRLRSDAQFHDCAEATYAVAVEHYGAASDAARAVARAWAEVGVPLTAVTPRLPVRRAANAAPAIDAVPVAGGEI